MPDPIQNKRLISPSPHAHSGDSVRRIMLSVLLALAPAAMFACWHFGWNAARLMIVCAASCVLFEYACRAAMRRDPSITDFSAVVTGVLLAMNLPPDLPSWMAIVGAFFAIVIAKQVFGGIGYNLFNPALIGRVVLLISFPMQMTSWSQWHIPHPLAGADAVTSATPLGLLKTSVASGHGIPFLFNAATAWQFFLGFKNGCIGEVSGLALLIGGLYLLWRRAIYWQTPVCYLATVALMAAALQIADPVHQLGPLFHLLTGGVLLGAIFMATDMVTSPVTKTGMAIFGIGCGVLTMVIRLWGGYPEGTSFAILLMNAVVPLINRFTRPRVFGHVRRPKKS